MKPVVFLTVALLGSVFQAQAQAITQADALKRVFSAPELKPEWFSPDFLAGVPFATIKAQLGGIRAAYGAFLRLETLNDRPLAVFERGTLLVTIASLDAQGRLTGFGAVPGPANARAAPAAQDMQMGADLLTRLFQADQLDVGLFSPAFLLQVPEAQLKGLFASIRAENGKFVKAEVTPNGWRLTFEKGALDVPVLTVNEQHLITALQLVPAVQDRTFKSLDEARAAFTALPGQVSLLVREVSGNAGSGTAQPALQLNPGRVLAVGSTFKLAILGELQAQIKAGKLSWTDQLTLTQADKSLPSGTLQDAPVGSKFTVRDVALRMIRDSDNTATDLLLRTVGRAGVEARLGQSAMPSTREAFVLKAPANAELLRAYRASSLNTQARRAALAQAAAAPLPNVAVFAGGAPLALDVEWFATTERLCTLMADVAGLDVMQVNPGAATPGDFSRVSFKGGSESGVLNLTTQVTNKAGKTYCVSATWNGSQALNDRQFISYYQAVLKLLR